MRDLPSRLATLLLPALLASGCQDPVAMAVEEETGTVEMVFDVAGLEGALVADELIASFARANGGPGAGTAFEDTVAVGGSSATVAAALRPGRWNIAVALFQGGDQIGFGEGSALVYPGFVTRVDIELQLGTGALELRVRWAEDFTGTIADLSDRPVEVEIGAFGTFEVHGLSRIGWDIEVVESPLDGGRTHKDPGRVSFPDIVLTGLTSTREQVDALAAWIANPAQMTHLVFRLEGLGGEYALVTVFEARFRDADATIQPSPVPDQVTLAGLRVEVPVEALHTFESRTLMELSEYGPVDPYPGCPAPGHAVEIERANAPPPIWPCYAQGQLALPAVGSSDDLRVPSLRNGPAIYQWALDTRLEAQTLGCACGNRSSISVIPLEGPGLESETGRINLFETWPASFTFFDPDIEYGQRYLFGVNIVTDRVEQGL